MANVYVTGPVTSARVRRYFHASTTGSLIASCSLCLLLVACGGGGGGDRAPGVETGPVPPNGPVIPPPPDLPSTEVDVGDLTEFDEVVATITSVTMDSPPTVTFTLIANGYQAVTGVTTDMLRASLANLIDNDDDFGVTGWTSTIRTTEDPVCRSQADVTDSTTKCSTFTTETDPEDIDESARKVRDDVATGKIVRDHITTESGGALSENETGYYTYNLVTDPGAPASLSELHRTCLQFSLNAPTNNACVDFVPADLARQGERATSIDDGFYNRYPSKQIVADGTCNSCHAKLSFHGGGRTETAYCVTCHNPVTTDANSENSVDFAVMVHRIHQSKNLPSVEGGTPYKIWGFNNGEYNYSTVSYPQTAYQCTRCHAGSEDFSYAESEGLPSPRSVETPDGHRWATYQGRKACESCHDDKTGHFTSSGACIGCHDAQERHRNSANEAGLNLNLVIDSVSDTAAGERPIVAFSIQDTNGRKLNLKSSDDMCQQARWDLRMPHDAATELVARISGSGAPADLEGGSGNNFTMRTGVDELVPAGVDTIGVMVDWNFPSDCDDGDSEKARLDAAVSYIASTAESPTARRKITDVDGCNDCHNRMLETFQKHGGTRSVNSPEACVACHNNEFATSDRSREMAIMTHALHAPSIRESAHGSYTEARLQYPGDLSDCDTCHVNDSQLLPLPVQRLPIRTNSSPAYTTPTAGVCGACHDDTAARSHMQNTGGALFDVDRESALAATESCDGCHRTGGSAAVEDVHNK